MLKGNKYFKIGKLVDLISVILWCHLVLAPKGFRLASWMVVYCLLWHRSTWLLLMDVQCLGLVCLYSDINRVCSYICPLPALSYMSTNQVWKIWNISVVRFLFKRSGRNWFTNLNHYSRWLNKCSHILLIKIQITFDKTILWVLQNKRDP